MTTLPTIATFIIAIVITSVAGIWIIPILRRLKFGQTILDIGPRWHKDKQGTPTMGGVLFAIGITTATVLGFAMLKISIKKDLLNYTPQNTRMLFAGLLMAIGFGFVGFLDDYIKVSSKQNEGLTPIQKLIFQCLIAVSYLIAISMIGEHSTIVWLPFIGQIQLGFLYYPLATLGIMYMVNVVNLTDGIDGLCSSVTLVSAIGFLWVSAILSFSTMQILSAALAGGCVGFLIWNIYPAKVFMGDTGSFFLGGVVVALAFGMRIPIIVLFMGMVYILEGLSVMIQTTYFKYTRKKTGTGQRIFKMTPIHHHFEMLGWSENKIVLVFSLVQAVFCVVGVLAVKSM